MDLPKMYTISDLSKILGVDRRSIYRYLKDGKIKAVKFGRQWRISEADLKELLDRGISVSGVKAPAEKQAE